MIRGVLQRSMVATVLAAISITTAAAQWVASSSMPYDRILPVAAIIGDTLYVWGGLSTMYSEGGNPYLKGGVKTHLQTAATWDSIPSLPSSRLGAFAAAVEGKIYILGGTRRVGVSWAVDSLVLEYDPATNALAVKGAMPRPLSASSGAVIDGRIYLFGGTAIDSAGRVTYTSRIEVYDPATNVWSQLGNAPYAADNIAVASLDSIVYLTGGANESDIRHTIAYRGVFSGTGFTWSRFADYPFPIAGGGGTSVNGVPVVAGGDAPAGASRSAFWYNEASGAWQPFYPLPVSVQYGAAPVRRGDDLYLLGGDANRMVLRLMAGEPTSILRLGDSSVTIVVQRGTEREGTLALRNEGIVDLQATIAVPSQLTWLRAPSTFRLPPGNDTTLALSVDARSLAVGRYQDTFTISSNDRLRPTVPVSIELYVVDTLVTQRQHAVLEAGVGHIYPASPNADRLVDTLQREHGDDLIVLRYHTGGNDAMQTSEGNTVLQRFQAPGYPHGAVNRIRFPERQIIASSYNFWRGYVEEVLRRNNPAPISILVDSLSLDRKLKRISLRGNLMTAAPIPYPAGSTLRLTLLVKQDSIIHPQRAPQSGGGGVVTVDDYRHDDVVRDIWPGPNGLSIQIPHEFLQEGMLLPGMILRIDTIFTIDIPQTAPAIDWGRMRLVALAHLDNSTQFGPVLQGVETPLPSAVADIARSESIRASLDITGLYPNPAARELHVIYSVPRRTAVEIEIVDMMGRSEMAMPTVVCDAGEYSHAIDVEGVRQGIHMVVIRGAGKTSAKMVTIMR